MINFEEKDLASGEVFLIKNSFCVVTNKRAIITNKRAIINEGKTETTIYLKNISAIKHLKQGFGLLAILLIVIGLILFLYGISGEDAFLLLFGFTIPILGAIIGFRHRKNCIGIFSSGNKVEITSNGYIDSKEIEEFINCLKMATAEL